LSAPLGFYFVIANNRDILDEYAFRDKFQSLYTDYKEDSKLAILYSTLFLLRRLLYALSLVLFKDSCYFQWLIYMGLSEANLFLIIIISPFKSRLDNALELFNELTIIGVG